MSVHRRSDVGSSLTGPSLYEVADPQRHQSNVNRSEAVRSSSDGPHPRPENDSQAIVNTYKQLDQRIKNFCLQVNIPPTLLHVSQAKSFAELDSLLAGCRQLGRSYALILATRDLREGLENLLAGFHENASHMAPDLPERRTTLTLDDTKQPFYFWLEALAKACDTFRERLDEFKDMEENEKVKDVMMIFSEDLMYRVSCLRTYEDALETNYIRTYINNLADEMGNHLDNLVLTFTFFHQYGVPAMKYEQKRATEVLLTISTVSTFFSAVTATTLQTSLSIQGNDESNHLIFVVNTFWFSSLVFSIGSALNSLLAVVWKRTPYGSRGRRLPVLMTIWAHGSAPVFLAISIASFWAGLVLFAYSSGQKRHTQIVTLVTTAITSFGLLTMAAWFGYEQYIAPLLLPDAPWRPFGKRIHEWKSEKSRHLIHADQWRVRRSSLSSSNYSTVSIPSSNSSSDSPTTDEVQSQARMRWKRSINRVLTSKALPKVLKEKPSKTELPADATPTPMDDNIQFKSPFLLSIPDKPLLTILLPDEAIQDIEYSPDGKYLAITW
ncbi:hypothetical protein C0993_011688 [Termitomyces sp. T159_Od127]|nr:hypothetical protein C0993_011688 [Termitomyces sp. T159_Od127]